MEEVQKKYQQDMTENLQNKECCKAWQENLQQEKTQKLIKAKK